VPESYRILHVLRAPIGGLFRHVADLAIEQAKRGHTVGVIADATPASEFAEKKLKALEENLSLGISRVPMSRDIGKSDKAAIAHVNARAIGTGATVLHGHGAKGGAYVRLSNSPALKVYTPHGGSLHYSAFSPVGFFYLASERWMKRRTGLFLFESEYALNTFRKKIGAPALAKVVHNGIRPEELEKVEPEADAVDFIYVGELRKLKGPDVLIEALSILARDGWSGSAYFYGDGPDRAALEAQVNAAGLVHQIHFPGALPAREAFLTGQVLVLPSRGESLPYIALEAAGAEKPLVATNVGGLPEIFGIDSDRLVEPGNAAALAAAMSSLRNEGDAGLVVRLHNRVAEHFTVQAMTDGVLSAYAEALKKPS
jgi:glycosyltransferase involved in cell wall biosynthesis